MGVECRAFVRSCAQFLTITHNGASVRDMAHSTANPQGRAFTIEQLRAEYIEQGLSRRAFAAKIGVPEPTLRGLENGRGIRPANAKLVADHFGVRVADVLALAEARTVAP